MVLIIERIEKAELEGGGIECMVGKGLLVFVGIEKEDREEIVEKAAARILHMRMFEDAAGKIKLSLKDIGGSVMLIPNFSLAAEINGSRLSFDKAMPASAARHIYKLLAESLSGKAACCCGIFGSFMRIKAEHSGPLNVVLKV